METSEPSNLSDLNNVILGHVPKLVTALRTPFGTSVQIAAILTDLRKSYVSAQEVQHALLDGSLHCVRGDDGSPVYWLGQTLRPAASAGEFRPTEAVLAFRAALTGGTEGKAA